MSEFLMPTLTETWKDPTVATGDSSIITLLGLVEGDILLYLDAQGTTSLRKLIRHLAWSAPMVMMGVGVLIRQGLVRGVQSDLDLIVEPVAVSGVHVSAAPQEGDDEND